MRPQKQMIKDLKKKRELKRRDQRKKQLKLIITQRNNDKEEILMNTKRVICQTVHMALFPYQYTSD